MDEKAQIKRAGVIGFPIKHSLSPVIHNYWLRKYGIEGEYKAYEVRPENLEKFLKEDLSKLGLSGVNITIPHKESAYKLIYGDKKMSFDDITEKFYSHLSGAINTVIIKDKKLSGMNTDISGFINNINDTLPDLSYENLTAVILGAGGAARAIISALLGKRVKKIIITNRTKDKIQKIMSQFSSAGIKIQTTDWNDRNEILSEADMLVNTTSLGMKGQPELDIKLDKLPKDALVTDIVYNPLQTKLLKAAKERGNTTIDGLGMLLHQAAPAFVAFFDPQRKVISGLPEVNGELRKEVIKEFSK